MEKLQHICVVGPGIVGMPMAALLAEADLAPGGVTVVQRNSPTSGWKVAAINEGRCPIEGVEPALAEVVERNVAAGRLRATHEAGVAASADLILVCVQTDKDGIGPDYGPLLSALGSLADALGEKPDGHCPLLVIESTLAPSSLGTVVREHFEARGLEEGRDLRLAFSPNRVMPGRLVSRVRESDKVVAGLSPGTAEAVAEIYGAIVTSGRLHVTGALTGEVEKTFENAWRDVRIAFAAEVVRHCDEIDVDFFALRDAVNARLGDGDGASADGGVVPTGALLVPTLGVGGHCLPKDGILLWWRAREAGVDAGESLILGARAINDASPAWVLTRMERTQPRLGTGPVALLGAAYRFDSEDTRNSPTLVLANLLREREVSVRIHDPHVRAGDANLVATGTDGLFTRDLGEALKGAERVVFCVAHQAYRDALEDILGAPGLTAVYDACNLVPPALRDRAPRYGGIGRGRLAPDEALVEATLHMYERVARGGANELERIVDFLNERYARTETERIDFEELRALAATCVTGCHIDAPGPVPEAREALFASLLAAMAH